jgi:hypothetical protein
MSAGFGYFDASCHGRVGITRPEHEWQSPHKLDRCCERCGTLATVFFDAATRARTAFLDTIKAPASCHGAPKKKP